MRSVTIIGAGLAGSEAAWQVAEAGIQVNIYEMRPFRQTGAHVTDGFAELVCSNSLGSNLKNKASGLLKDELRLLDSLLIECADQHAIPAGSALAVDRQRFSTMVTQKLIDHPKIRIYREEVTKIPDCPSILSSGPLTSPLLEKAIQEFTGSEQLFFYDAISPIIEADSIDMTIAFKGSRYTFEEEGSGDYINCPLDQEQYQRFLSELSNAETFPLREFENQIPNGIKTSFFEACLPIEIMAKRNPMSLEFGPMRPVGIHNPHKEEKPRAVVQLRQENHSASEYNMVGFQTNLKTSEQQRVFRTIPGLENATFSRFGQMHRNTYINSPRLIEPTLQSRFLPELFFAGQLTGIEGYVGNIASGLIAGLNIVRFLNGKPLLIFPEETMIGSLLKHISRSEDKWFQPVKANYGLLPPILMLPRSKTERGDFYSKKALLRLKQFLKENRVNS
jgi:methylenetetrahydrofolate--tRNA-(uracil-5-)-methyltransferase